MSEVLFYRVAVGGGGTSSELGLESSHWVSAATPGRVCSGTLCGAGGLLAAVSKMPEDNVEEDRFICI